MRWFTLLFIFIFTIFGLVGLLAVVPTDAQTVENDPSKLADALAEEIASRTPSDQIPILIEFAGKADVQTRLPEETNARHAQIVARLQTTAAQSQVGMLTQLAGRSAQEVSRIRSFWIVNQVAAHVSAELIPQLTSDPNVRHIRLDLAHQYLDLETLNHDGDTNGHNRDYPHRRWGIDDVNAPDAWQFLNITGTGSVVAIMDTGVDWQHPALQANYRGRDGNHAANWFSSIDGTILQPADSHGHGTHVAGSAVGADQIGVAPGAEWIAVQMLNASGIAFESEIRSAFQWLLAPNGDPANAPDIVNASWGSSIPTPVFLDDVRMLQAVGIVPVFAMGNAGPFESSISYPAGYTNTLSVGAFDHRRQVTWFSSRGPSLLTDQQKPHLTAPGARVYSAHLENGYHYLNGTSMATPHVVGTLALLKSAESTLTENDLTFILTSTTQTSAIDDPVPNITDGWGQLDAYAALATRFSTEVVTYLPHLTGIGSFGVPTYLTITQVETGRQIYKTIAAHGSLQLPLPTGYTYRADATAFGMQPTSTAAAPPTPGSLQQVIFNRLPSHTLTGKVQQADGSGIAADVTIEGTPLSTTSNAAGDFTFIVPSGAYTVSVSEAGWGSERRPLVFNADTSQTFTLSPIQRTLLVDNEGWVYHSELDYYRDALTALNHSFDEHAIMTPQFGVPTIEQLQTYDTVIWSAPYFSPGFVLAGEVISQYLDFGGNLLISGQNIANWDGNGFTFQRWWGFHLRGRYETTTGPSNLVSSSTAADTGSAEISQFANLAININAGSSADNQTRQDEVSWEKYSLTAPLFETPDGRVTSLAAGLCRPFKLAYYGFGLEGVQTAGERELLLSRALDYFDDPPATDGVRILHDPIDTLAIQGERYTYTLRIANISETKSDTIEVRTDSSWPTTVTPSSLTLDSCSAETVVVTVDVPASASFDTIYTDNIVAEGSNASSILSMQHNTPGNVLFVDDDRWYDYEDRYRVELERLGIPYDYWNVGWRSWDGHGSISAELLNQYDIVIWYVGNDWFEPLTTAEVNNLSNYLRNGGRLFLTGQSILSYHATGPLRPYLGVLYGHDEMEMGNLFGDSRGALPSAFGGQHALNYSEYSEFSDGLVPGGQAVGWSDGGQAAGIANSGISYADQPWRSVFWAVPPEIMTYTAAADVVNQSVGWLSDLGESTIEVDRRTTGPTETRFYTITVRNLPQAPLNSAIVTNSLPVSLTLDSSSLVGATYDVATRQVRWSGSLASGGQHVITYQAQVAGSIGQEIDNLVQFYYARHRLRFERSAPTWVGIPDVTDSTLSAEFTTLGEPITFTFRMTNSGASGTLYTTFFTPPDTGYLSHSASSGVLSSDGEVFRWNGTLNHGEGLTVSIGLTTTFTASLVYAYDVVLIEDGISDPIVRDLAVHLPGEYRLWMPFVPFP